MAYLLAQCDRQFQLRPGRDRVAPTKGDIGGGRVRPRHEHLVAQLLGYLRHLAGRVEGTVVVAPGPPRQCHHLQPVGDRPVVADHPRHLDTFRQPGQAGRRVEHGPDVVDGDVGAGDRPLIADGLRYGQRLWCPLDRRGDVTAIDSHMGGGPQGSRPGHRRSIVHRQGPGVSPSRPMLASAGSGRL